MELKVNSNMLLKHQMPTHQACATFWLTRSLCLGVYGVWRCCNRNVCNWTTVDSFTSLFKKCFETFPLAGLKNQHLSLWLWCARPTFVATGRGPMNQLKRPTTNHLLLSDSFGNCFWVGSAWLVADSTRELAHGLNTRSDNPLSKKSLFDEKILRLSLSCSPTRRWKRLHKLFRFIIELRRVGIFQLRWPISWTEWSSFTGRLLPIRVVTCSIQSRNSLQVCTCGDLYWRFAVSRLFPGAHRHWGRTTLQGYSSPKLPFPAAASLLRGFTRSPYSSRWSNCQITFIETWIHELKGKCCSSLVRS